MKFSLQISAIALQLISASALASTLAPESMTMSQLLSTPRDGSNVVGYVVLNKDLKLDATNFHQLIILQGAYFNSERPKTGDVDMNKMSCLMTIDLPMDGSGDYTISKGTRFAIIRNAMTPESAVQPTVKYTYIDGPNLSSFNLALSKNVKGSNFIDTYDTSTKSPINELDCSQLTSTQVEFTVADLSTATGGLFSIELK